MISLFQCFTNLNRTWFACIKLFLNHPFSGFIPWIHSFRGEKKNWQFWLTQLIITTSVFNLLPFQYNRNINLVHMHSTFRIILWHLIMLCYAADVISMASVCSEVTFDTVTQKEFLDFYAHFLSRLSCICLIGIISVNMKDIPHILNVLIRLETEKLGKWTSTVIL